MCSSDLAAQPSVTRRSRTSGVRPMHWVMSSRIPAGRADWIMWHLFGCWFLEISSDRRQHEGQTGTEACPNPVRHKSCLDLRFPESPSRQRGDDTSHHHSVNRPHDFIPFRSSVIPAASAGGFWSPVQQQTVKRRAEQDWACPTGAASRECCGNEPRCRGRGPGGRRCRRRASGGPLPPPARQTRTAPSRRRSPPAPSPSRSAPA